MRANNEGEHGIFSNNQEIWKYSLGTNYGGPRSLQLPQTAAVFPRPCPRREYLLYIKSDK
jgi:hypothetical protein